jgi:UDP-2,3-diacylglucosamine pyrophosphatase LpxH
VVTHYISDLHLSDGSIVIDILPDIFFHAHVYRDIFLP